MISLLKYFSVAVPRGHGQSIDLNQLKKPDFLFTLNIKLMQKLNKVLNTDNNQVKPE